MEARLGREGPGDARRGVRKGLAAVRAIPARELASAKRKPIARVFCSLVPRRPSTRVCNASAGSTAAPMLPRNRRSVRQMSRPAPSSAIRRQNRSAIRLAATCFRPNASARRTTETRDGCVPRKPGPVRGAASRSSSPPSCEGPPTLQESRHSCSTACSVELALTKKGQANRTRVARRIGSVTGVA